MPDTRETLIDVQRVEWLNAFFATWKFDRREDLFAAVERLTLDPASLSRGYDLRDAAMWGWGYWLIFLKGWLEYRARRDVDSDNTYARYMTSVVDIDRYDPGI